VTCPCCIADRQRDRNILGSGPDDDVDGSLGLSLSDVPDFDGVGSECGMEIELPPAVRRAVAAAPSMVVLEPGAAAAVHCDQLSEDDERSLMVLGCLDGSEWRAWSGKSWGYGTPGFGTGRILMRRPAP
jgi:hypothetical protein